MKEFYTTGEAQNIFKGYLSRSTISRYFDGKMKRGKLLHGTKNPFTGKRMISRESIQELADRYNVTIKL